MDIFAERDLREFLDDRRADAKRAFESLSNEAILDVPTESLFTSVLERFLVEPLTIRCDDVSATVERRQIPAETFPSGFTVRAGSTYPKAVMLYHVPFTGNRALLSYGDLRYQPWSMRVRVIGSDITFEIVDFSDKPSAVEREALDCLDGLRKAAARYSSDIAAFNESLQREALDWARRRREDAEKHTNALASLKIPIRRIPVQALPPTLIAPVSQKQIVIAAQKPPTEKGWVLGQDVYESILGLVHDWGVVMERHPSTYAGKDEEALRDLFLLLLAPHFDYAGGETFNKNGKTDILIRHERQNVFVAECKIWRGKEEFKEAIDQLLGYLTWRDSKTALIVFVRNKDIDNVRRQIEPTLRSHPCFVGHSSRQEGWADAELRLAPGSDRTARCAVLVFHMPEPQDPR